MREYSYRALTPYGQTVNGLRHAPDPEALEKMLFAQDLILVDCRRSLSSMWRHLSPMARVSHGELRDFTLHLATSLSAGIPIIAALHDFEQGEMSGAFATIVADVRDEIAGGSQVDAALAKHPRVFSEVYVSLVAAGQRSGNLDRNFAELVEHLEWLDELRSRARQAMIYPCILLSGLLGLFLLLMLYVLPRFMDIFAQQDFELPAITRRVMGSWDFLRSWWLLLLGGTAATIAMSGAAGRSRRGRFIRDSIMLRVPVIGAFRHKLALSRFARHFSLLLTSGVDLLSVLKLNARVVGDAVMSAEILAIAEKVRSGRTLAESFADSGWFPPLMQRLIAVGEQSGNLDATLAKAAEYVDKEIPRALKRAFTLFEATVMVLLGGMIAVFALALLMPILQMRSQIG